MLGGSNGRLTLLLTQGNVPGLLPALIDLDGARVLVKLVGSSPESVRCSAVDIMVKNGHATPNVAVVETDTTVLNLTGELNLGSEQIDMKLSQAPKKPSFLSLRTPILIRGTLLDPHLAPAPAPLTARGAAALLLGLINPLASMFALMRRGRARTALPSHSAELPSEVHRTPDRRAKKGAVLCTPPYRASVLRPTYTESRIAGRITQTSVSGFCVILKCIPTG